MERRRHGIDDYVVPTDLPRTFVCRVVGAHAVGTSDLQVLEMVPVHGPWPPGTRLIRGSDVVRAATPSEVDGTRASTTPRSRRPGVGYPQRFGDAVSAAVARGRSPLLMSDRDGLWLHAVPPRPRTRRRSHAAQRQADTQP